MLEKIKMKGEETMSEEKSDLNVGRRAFLGGVGVAGAAAATALSPIPRAGAQTPSPQTAPPDAPPQPAGYTYLKPQEVLFVEAVVDHMVPNQVNSFSQRVSPRRIAAH